MARFSAALATLVCVSSLSAARADAPAPAPGVAITIAEPPCCSLGPSPIRRVIRRRHNAIRHCYNLALLGAPELEGTVVTQLRIPADRKVRVENVTGVGDDELKECIADALSGLRVPRHLCVAPGAEPPELLVRYPFHLRRPEDDPKRHWIWSESDLPGRQSSQ